MRQAAKVIRKDKTPPFIPDLIVQTMDGQEHQVDPFVSCLIDLDEYNNDPYEINNYIDTLIGCWCEIDLENCHQNRDGIYLPGVEEHFKIYKLNETI